jgi:hypothetical protein
MSACGWPGRPANSAVTSGESGAGRRTGGRGWPSRRPEQRQSPAGEGAGRGRGGIRSSVPHPPSPHHAGIARSALRYADEIVIPCAPNPIEINRTTPVRDEIAEVEPVRDRPARSAILLNRCITRAHSISDARQALQDLGYDVLAAAVPRLEVYAQSFGLPIPDTGRDSWRQVTRELVARCAPPCRVRS